MEREVGLRDIASVRALREALAREGPFDIVHGHSSKAGALIRSLPRGRAMRVYSPHAFSTLNLAAPRLQRGFYETVERALMHRTELLIASSSAEADEARRLGLPPERVRLVLNGMRTPAFLPREAARRVLGIADGEVCIGFVGRLSAQKRPLRFLDMLQALACRSNHKAVMIGDGEQLQPVRERLAELGPERVSLMSCDTAWTYMRGFDLIVLTSAYEGMPYVLLEALHAGLPMVADIAGGVPEMVLEGVNGYVLPQGASPQEMAASVGRLVDTPELRRRMAEASLARARAFDVAPMADAILDAYAGALGRQDTGFRPRQVGGGRLASGAQAA